MPEKRIKVLELSPSFSYGGGERNCITFSKYLNKGIFDVVVSSWGKSGPLEKVLENYSIPYVSAEGDVNKIIGIVQDRHIDVIHIHRSGHEVCIETEIIKSVKKVNPNLVVVETNFFGKYDKSLEGDIDCSLFQSMMHINERYLPASHKSFDFETMKVFYNMVDEEEFVKYKASEVEINAYRGKLGIEEGEYLLGKVGRQAIEKWSDLVIDMMPYLHNLNPKIKIALVGCPPSREKRIKHSKYKDNFIILKPINDQKELHLFYQSVDILAHSSKIGECNGNTINEAMFWGKPVVINSTPNKDNGQLEQVLHGMTGYVANRPHTYAEAINNIISNPTKAREMGEEARKRVKKMNDPELVTSRLEKIFIDKLAKKGHNLALSLVSKYANIEYQPNAESIISYRGIYRERLRWNFGKERFSAKLAYIFCFPIRVYRKLMDFVEHRIG